MWSTLLLQAQSFRSPNWKPSPLLEPATSVGHALKFVVPKHCEIVNSSLTSQPISVLFLCLSACASYNLVNASRRKQLRMSVSLFVLFLSGIWALESWLSWYFPMPSNTCLLYSSCFSNCSRQEGCSTTKGQFTNPPET